MMKRFFIPAITAVIALAACTKEAREQGAQSADASNAHALSVEIESGAYESVDGETKASMEAVIRVNWKAGDEVSVVNATKGKLLGGCLTSQSDGESAVFEGTVTGTIVEGDKLYYIYPRVDENTTEVDFTNCNISLADQKYDGTKTGDVCFYGYAEDLAGSTNTISKKIKFDIVTSYAHLNMSNLPAKGSSLSCMDISNINEGFTWALSDATLSAVAYPGKNAISVKCSNVNITAAGNAVVRFAIPASASVSGARIVTVNNAYTNDKYAKSEIQTAAYYNQLYSTWASNVNVSTADPSKTAVTITNNDSKELAEGIIPASAFDDSAKPTEITLGGMGTVTFDGDAAAKINTNTAGAEGVLFKVENVTAANLVPDADIVIEVTMKTSDGSGAEVFNSVNAAGKATMSIFIGEDVSFVNTVSLVDDSGTPITGGVIPGSIVFDPSTHILTFQVEHFSKYAVDYVKEADFVSVTGVSLDNNTLELPIEGTETLTATIAPENATNKKVTWSSSNDAAATVDENGKVTAVAAGTATITATTVDGNFTAVCLVTIVAPQLPAGALPGVFSVSDDGGTHVKQIYFSQGNLWYGPVTKEATATFNFETNQNDFLPASGDDYHDDHISYFYWSKDARVACSYIKYDEANTQYEIVPGESDVFFTNADGFKVTVDGEEQTGWRTLTVNEWKYLFDTRVVNGGTGQGYSYSWAITYGGKYGLVIYPDNYEGDPISGEVSVLPEGVVFLLGAGNRVEGAKSFSNFGSVCYWASTPTAAGQVGGPRGSSISCNYPATWFSTGSTTVSRKNCYCIRLITECQ